MLSREVTCFLSPKVSQVSLHDVCFGDSIKESFAPSGLGPEKVREIRAHDQSGAVLTHASSRDNSLSHSRLPMLPAGSGSCQ